MSVEVDPLSSADGTPVTVEPTHGQGQAKVTDASVIELLVAGNQTLIKILAILELEFEMQTEEFTDGEN